MNADGSGVVRLTTDPNDDCMASWSPDGTKIGFQSLRNGANYQVYSMNVDGSAQVNLTNTVGNDIEPSWSPNGSKIAFASDRDHVGTNSVYVMNSNGTGQQRLTFSAATFDDRQPSWSRDGAKIAFVSTRDSVTETWTETDDYEIPQDDGQTFPRSLRHINREVYVMNADGSGQTRLTNDLGIDDSPSWSPDGTKIVFRSDRERDCCDPNAQVWTMNADGSGQVDLSNNQIGDYTASWDSGTFNQNPVANAGGGYSGVPAQAISFNGSNSSDPDGTIVSYSWSFGDGGTGSGANPTHAYAANGTYTVSLTVTDNAGAQASAQTSASIAGASSGEIAMALLDPFNQTGNQLQARDCEWSVPLVSLPGRAGLDLGLTLSYSSLVWTPVGSFMYFDEDNGDPSPGFHLGFPTIGDIFLDTQVNVNARMMVNSSGRRVEFRYVNHNANGYDLYETADSSYLQLKDYGQSMSLFTSDGNKMDFSLSGGEWHCTLIQDRNGNQITPHYEGGDLQWVKDTLGRVINFHYDTYQNVDYIWQTWTVNGVAVEHRWATFGWETKSFTPSFSQAVGGFTNRPMLTQVGLADGSYYKFDYNNFGQVNAIKRYTSDGDPSTATDDVQRSSIAYDYDTTQPDCPRITASHVTAESWASNVTTTFEDLGSGWHRMTMPDGSDYRELYQLNGWQRGLPTLTQNWRYLAPAPEKTTSISWDQDATCSGCQTNPRVTETIIDDTSGNHRRRSIAYDQYAQYGLPHVVTEYDNGGSTPLRQTITEYNLNEPYLSCHLLGLVSEVKVYDSVLGKYLSKITYDYDNPSAIDPQATNAVQHSSGFNTFYLGRGNVTSVSRWNITNESSIIDELQALTTSFTYDAAGSMLTTTDPGSHVVRIEYNDKFPDDRNTFAYATKVKDADWNASTAPNNFSTAEYNYDFGATTLAQGAPPAGQSQGLTQTIEYDDATRLKKVSVNGGAYTRYDYGSNYWADYSTVNNPGDDVWNVHVFDGLGQVYASYGTNPHSDGLYKEQFTWRDSMGRVVQVSNPFEINSSGQVAGGDAVSYITQTYDWKGRPLRTIHPDGYYTELSYTGCGCAGGEVVTAADEVGRRRRSTSDTLGRMIKAEELNWDGSPYSTANYFYDALDQIQTITHEGQTRSFSYDGYGRLSQRSTPEQGTTTYAYNADGTLLSMMDARHVTATYGYNNNRHLVSSINYDVSHDPSGNTAGTPPVSFVYDAAGNRTSMTDGLGSASYGYDSLSRMTSETRSFNGVGSYSLGYTYNYANELTSISNPWGVWIGYNYDNNGRLRAVYANNVPDNVTTLANDITYRAFGAVKSIYTGDHQTLSASYDNRMRPTSWNVPNVLGYNYNYRGGYSDGGNNQVSYARNLYDNTLDRSYEYDQVGALVVARSGAEARAAFGIDGQEWGLSDGPYAHAYDYDKQGNMTWRFGWGGEIQGGAHYGGDTTLTYNYSNGKNQRDGFTYDQAGNLSIDNVAHYVYGYDATGQQTSAFQVNGPAIGQTYDGDGLRGKKIENGLNVTYYLRSAVLGGAVVAELDTSGARNREYYYRGDQLLALQQGGHMNWVHEDPITKSQRVTDVYGGVTSTVELDPWGANTARSSPTVFQPQNFTGMTDANGDQDVKARRYSPTGRFPQPDPSSGSYDYSNPQSLNRYAYVGNDPVNFRDPSGMEMQSSFCGAESGFGECGSSGFWGLGNLMDRPRHPGLDTIHDREMQFDVRANLGHYRGRSREGHSRNWTSDFDPQDAWPEIRVIAAALDKCLQSKFKDLNGGPAARLVSFDPSSKGRSGSTIVDYMDKSAPGRTGVYKVNNDVTSYSYATVPRRDRGSLGFTRPNSPLTNFTVSDVEMHPAADPVLDNIVGAFIATQIHELGNSIDHASGNYIGDFHSNLDPDSGYQLELCVAGELRSQGFTGK